MFLLMHLQIIVVIKAATTFDAKVVLVNVMFLQLLNRIMIDVALWTEVMRVH
jgi:hypothetical protein